MYRLHNIPIRLPAWEDPHFTGTGTTGAGAIEMGMREILRKISSTAITSRNSGIMPWHRMYHLSLSRGGTNGSQADGTAWTETRSTPILWIKPILNTAEISNQP